MLRATFDGAAGTYQSARPDYPAELFADLVETTGLTPPGELLEVGCGPGKATVPLAARGFRITAVELGPSLARAARQNLRAFPEVTVVQAAFEDWAPAPGHAFDLVYAATAWPWIDPESKYAKAAAVLRPGGHLAVWGAGHAFPVDFDPFFTEIQDVYDQIGETHGGEWPPPPPERVAGDSAELEASGYFDVVGVRRYVWAIDYRADTYINLLDTFSGHIAMAPARRRYLYDEIRRRVAARPTQTIRRHWMAVLTVGRRGS